MLCAVGKLECGIEGSIGKKIGCGEVTLIDAPQ